MDSNYTKEKSPNEVSPLHMEPCQGTWQSGSLECHQDNKLENSIQYSEERKSEQRGKEIEIDKKIFI